MRVMNWFEPPVLAGAAVAGTPDALHDAVCDLGGRLADPWMLGAVLRNRS